MTLHRAATLVSALALACALVAGCGSDDDPEAGPTSSAPSTSAPTSGAADSTAPTSGAADSTTPATDGDGGTDVPPFPANTEPDTGEPSADSFVTVTQVRTGRHDGFDRVVFEVAGTGTPGWDVRYVDEATSQGSGETVPVAGDATLQVTITGVGYPTETGIEEYDGQEPLPGNGTEIVTEIVWDTTFEGTSVAFVGTTGRRSFRVHLVEDPARVVLEVVQ